MSGPQHWAGVSCPRWEGWYPSSNASAAGDAASGREQDSVPVLAGLRAEARSRRLWNLLLPGVGPDLRQPTTRVNDSTTQTGLSPPSRSMVTLAVTRCPAALAATETSSTPARTFESTGAGAGKRNLLAP
ncbi:hypothetical protein FB390_6634 [Nocardia bhagyanarayanae]|uniref:Uncharacterized protein n=1 Tax=Nocardia bhagyanarayanae TaxID=1215925 RepID=A0A543EXZ2_9NOCA|nr:hypothetical protein FB390_6634 [Nocardia bhagyanarayanae]